MGSGVGSGVGEGVGSEVGASVLSGAADGFFVSDGAAGWVWDGFGEGSVPR